MSPARPFRPSPAKPRAKRSSGGARPYEPASRERLREQPASAEAVARPRVTSLVIDGVAEALGTILKFDGPADVLLSRFFRRHPSLGSRERGLIAEAVFHALRRYATLGWMMQPAQPSRAPRLAALVTLARQHGVDALDPRAVRGDLAAIKNALAVNLGAAPASIRAELPHWLFTAIEAQYSDALPMIEVMKQSAPLDLRVNSIKADRDTVRDELAAHFVAVEPTPYSPEGLRLADKPGLMAWPAYREGRVEVQDEGSQLIARLVQPRRGEMVVDFCAGAGGKTLALGALMRSAGRLYAFDVNEKRLAGLGPRLKRSGLSNVHPVAIRSEADVRVKRLNGKCDRVLVDAPCSGCGTLRRNPDLKWRFSESELARVNEDQHAVLAAAARLVKTGGRLVYATCSLLARENQEVIAAFLERHPEFQIVPAASVLRSQRIELPELTRFAPYFVMLPHLHGTDGFFAAILERAG